MAYLFTYYISQMYSTLSPFSSCLPRLKPLHYWGPPFLLSLSHHPCQSVVVLKIPPSIHLYHSTYCFVYPKWHRTPWHDPTVRRCPCACCQVDTISIHLIKIYLQGCAQLSEYIILSCSALVPGKHLLSLTSCVGFAENVNVSTLLQGPWSAVVMDNA